MLNRYKKSDHISYTLGTTLTIELLKRRPEQADMVYVHPDMTKNETYYWLENKCHELGIQFVENLKVFNRLADKENCYSIGVFVKYENDIAPKNDHLVLVNPGNSGNLGTIIRTMIGFGLNDLAIIRPGGDVFDPRTIRASMGAVFNVRFSYFDSFEEYSAAAGEHHIYPFMLQTNNDLSAMSPEKPYTLVFGNESSGLDDTYLNRGTPVRIRHMETIDSLNLPIAVAIALYQFTRECGF